MKPEHREGYGEDLPGVTVAGRPAQLVYSTAKFAKTRLSRAELIQLPTSEVHAKEMGTLLTVCGQTTSSWFKFWDLPFNQVERDRCPSCEQLLIARGLR